MTSRDIPPIPMRAQPEPGTRRCRIILHDSGREYETHLTDDELEALQGATKENDDQ